MDTINTDVFESLKNNMGDVMPQLIAIFLEDAEVLLNEIGLAIENQRPERVFEVVHTLKSSAKNMGADKLAALCLKIEESGKNKCTEGDLLSIYQEALKEMDRVKELLGKENL